MASTKCPTCAKPLRFPDNALGRKIKCPACSTAFVPSTVSQPPTLPAKEKKLVSTGNVKADPSAYSTKPDRNSGPSPPNKATVREKSPDDIESQLGQDFDHDVDNAHDEDSSKVKKGRKKKEEIKQTPLSVTIAICVPLLGALAGLGVVFMYWGGGAGLERLLGPVFIGIGLFAIMAAAMNWEWFMVFWSERASEVLGRTGLRIMYVMLGIVIIVFGVLGAMGVVDLRTKH